MNLKIEEEHLSFTKCVHACTHMCGHKMCSHHSWEAGCFVCSQGSVHCPIYIYISSAEALSAVTSCGQFQAWSVSIFYVQLPTGCAALSPGFWNKTETSELILFSCNTNLFPSSLWLIIMTDNNISSMGQVNQKWSDLEGVFNISCQQNSCIFFSYWCYISLFHSFF